MNRNSAKKQILLFIVGCLINLGMFCISKYAAFPLWLDYTGSLYISVLCGLPLGLLSIVLHTVILIVLIDGWTALLSVIPVLFLCIIGHLFGKAPDKSVQGGLAGAFIATVGSFIAGALAILCYGNLPHRYESYGEFFNVVLQSSGRFFAAVTMSSIITLTEILCTIALFGIAYTLTPKTNDNLIFKK